MVRRVSSGILLGTNVTYVGVGGVLGLNKDGALARWRQAVDASLRHGLRV